MTLAELIERLTDLRDDHGPDTEVRLMTQQNWPFKNGIHGVTTSAEMASADEDEEEDEPASKTEPVVVYIVEGDQLGYSDKVAWTTCD